MCHKYEYRGVTLDRLDKPMLIECIEELKREIDNLRRERDGYEQAYHAPERLTPKQPWCNEEEGSGYVV